MADNTKLPDRLAKLGQSLVMGSTEEIGNIAKATGQATVPTTPVEGLALGANTDQAKMLGGEPNIRNAIKIASEGTDRSGILTDEQRRGRVKEAKPGDTVAAAEDLSFLTSLDGRLSAAVQAEFKKAEESGSLRLSVDEEGLKDASKAAMAAGNPNATVDAISKAAKGLLSALGPTTPPNIRARALANLEALVPPELIGSLFGLNSADWAKTIATAIPNDLPMSSIGLTPEEVQRLSLNLGLTPDEIMGMGYQAFRLKAAEKMENKYANVQQLQAVANNATLPVSYRAAATSRLADLGAEGVVTRATESSQLAADLQKDETIEIGGMQFSLSAILDDDKMSQVLVAAADNPDALKGTMFENLIPFVQMHADELKKLRDTILPAAVADLDRRQDERANWKKFGSGNNIAIMDAGLMEAIFPGSTDPEVLAYRKAPRQGTGLWGALRSLPENDQVSMVNALNTISQQQPWLIPFLKNLTRSDLTALGFYSAAPNSAQNFAANLVKGASVANVLRQQNVPAGVVQSMLESVLGKDFYNQLDDWSKEAVAAAGGFGDYSWLFDANKDNVVDSPSQIAKNLLNKDSPVMKAANEKDGKKLLAGIENIPDLLSANAVASLIASFRTADADITANKAKIESAEPVVLQALHPSKDFKLDEGGLDGMLTGFGNKFKSWFKARSDIDKLQKSVSDMLTALNRKLTPGDALFLTGVQPSQRNRMIVEANRLKAISDKLRLYKIAAMNKMNSLDGINPDGTIRVGTRRLNKGKDGLYVKSEWNGKSWKEIGFYKKPPT